MPEQRQKVPDFARTEATAMYLENATNRELCAFLDRLYATDEEKMYVFISLQPIVLQPTDAIARNRLQRGETHASLISAAHAAPYVSISVVPCLNNRV